MKPNLLFPDRGVDFAAPPVWNEQALRQDLGLDTILRVMAQDDSQILSSATRILLAADPTDIAAIRYRQAVLADCLANPTAIFELYDVATKAGRVKALYLGGLRRYPHWLMNGAIDETEQFVVLLGQLREIGERRRQGFAAPGWLVFFDMLKHQLDSAYLDQVAASVETLKFRTAMALSAELGGDNKGSAYRLHAPPQLSTRHLWRRMWEALFPPKPPANSFAIDPRDESGHRALEMLQDEGMAATAIVLAEAKDRIRMFFDALRVELAFYMGCINLYKQLAAVRLPTCYPAPCESRDQRLSFHELCDAGLGLSIRHPVVGNSGTADGKGFVLVTGANQGGKSTFLRSVGLAQLMMQAGMFVTASSYEASVSDGVFTHYKREEDAAMASGKFDEELARMSTIVEHLSPTALVLFNESFAATNEREGSEIARQIVTALLERNIRFVFVTHLSDFAQGLQENLRSQGLFLRAERDESGRRSFRLREGEPLRTSFGEDLYAAIFLPELEAPEAAVVQERNRQLSRS